MRVLVPFDGSASTVRALRFAIGLIKSHKRARIFLVNVQNLATLGADEAMFDWEREGIYAAEQSAKILDKAMAICHAARIKADSRAEVGAIAPAIDRLARKLKVNQIIMGTRGLGSIKGLLLGSVASQVVHLAGTPVTLVK